MKILKPVAGETVPKGRRWEYKSILNAVTALKNGDFLPVVCGSDHEVRKLRSWCYTHRSLPMKIRSEGFTVYIGKKLEK